MFLGFLETGHTFFYAMTMESISQKSKFECLMNYFRLVYKRCEEDENYFNYASKFSLQRNCPNLKPIDHWYLSEKQLRSIQIMPIGSMEDCPVTNLKADFANEFLGGGVLEFGNVQEEIMFVICPELLLSVFLCAPMAENEAVIMVGA